MFKGSPFDQDIGAWTLSSVTDAWSMFENAASFNQNLCSWGSSFTQPSLDVTNMFLGSGCTSTASPDVAVSPITPLCYYCNTFASRAELDAAITDWISVGSSSVSTAATNNLCGSQHLTILLLPSHCTSIGLRSYWGLGCQPDH